MFRSLTSQLNYMCKRYAGHSKWANIKHIKGTKDAERNTLFTKLSRQIKVAVTLGKSTDPKKNSQLSQVIDQCKRFNMPTATLQNVLKSCENDKSNTQSYLIDIKGPGNCFILCELHTHQLHQIKMTIATQLRKTKSKYADGAGNHIFEEKGVIAAENSQISSKNKDEQLELATEHAIESNAEEVLIGDDNVFKFLSSRENFSETQNCLEKLGYTIVDASIDYVPLKLQDIGPSDYDNYEKLIKKLNDMPEVVRLFDNVNTS